VLTIGDFARYGRVSVRMLRHYDETGLLKPAHVDPATGYRSYSASQLARLNRLVALKELGFSLRQVRELLDDEVPAEQLRGMLRLREAEIENQIAASEARLAQVRARLALVAEESACADVLVKPIPAVRVAELSGIARSMDPDSIGPVVQNLFAELGCALATVRVQPTGPGIAYYTDAEDEDRVVVHACMPVNGAPGEAGSVSITDLPGFSQAATTLYAGSMDYCLPIYQALGRWVERAGYRGAGPHREITLSCPADRSQMVTEIQVPVEQVAGGPPREPPSAS
jgi:DNA-binding transcriptional MerR regulator